MEINKVVALLLFGMFLSGCASIEQIDNKTRQYGSNKPEFVINKISLQSYSVKYYGKPSVSEENALVNWNKKANSLCGKKKAVTTVIKNEAVSYLKRGQESNGVPNDTAVVVAACVATGEVGCALASVFADGATGGNGKSYRFVDGQVLCR